MDFFRSVFADDTEPLSVHEPEHDQYQAIPNPNPNPNPNPDSLSDPETNPHSPIADGDGAWSFGGLIKTLASRSESVIQTYRRDLEEFGTGLRKETAVIREVASRAVKDLPTSLDVGASVAQESLESVGQAIDDFGSSVWRGTAEIISHGRDTILAADHDSDCSSDGSHRLSNQFSNQSVGFKPYSRFDAQLRAIQCDANTYCEEPEDLSDFNEWIIGFELDEKGLEIGNLLEENEVMDAIYMKLVPKTIDHESFWSRYFYRVHRLKLVEAARANLVKRAIAGEEEELSWDVDDDDESNDITELKNDKELEKMDTSELFSEHKNVGTSLGRESRVESGERIFSRDSDDSGVAAETVSDKVANERDKSVFNSNLSVASVDEKLIMEGKVDNGESCKDSDVSIVSSQPSLPEEEDLGWDEIEDIGSNDENKVAAANGSPSMADLRKRLSAAEEEEDVSWDIEDDDEPVKS